MKGVNVTNESLFVLCNYTEGKIFLLLSASAFNKKSVDMADIPCMNRSTISSVRYLRRGLKHIDFNLQVYSMCVIK